MVSPGGAASRNWGTVGGRHGDREATELSSVPAPGGVALLPCPCVRGPKSAAVPRTACSGGAVGRARGHAPFPLAGGPPRPWLVVGTECPW